jgi:secreted PhoX family phosphatase
MNHHDDDISNESGNRPFEDILQSHLSRRQVLAGGVAVAAGSFLAGSGLAAAHQGHEAPKGRPRRLINFTPVAVADARGPWPVISPEYQFEVLIPWGTPIQPDGPAFNWPPSAADQAEQVGIGHDGMHYFPLARGKFGRGDGNEHGMLAVNMEFGGNQHILGKPAPESLEDVRVSQHAHGVAVVEIKKHKGQWQTVKSRRARRIHVNTPVTFSGPVAGHALLQTPAGNPTLGTVNNCASGPTPWGTYLTCEENFNGYFGATGAWSASAAQKRYGFSKGGFGYAWEKFDARFDLSNPAYVNEENRFGWVVEIDPMDADQVPVKRTALGRIKHEGATIAVGKGGRVVCYMGDDERFDYIYKFVSADNWQSMRARGQSPLDHGTLYVAKFHDDGSGEWLELSMNNPLVAAKFADQAEVLTYTRLAADAAGATPMDRPEWTTVAPNGDVYCTLTNNTNRGKAGFPGIDAANPIAVNSYGHIIRWHDADRHVGTTFTWDIFLIAQDKLGTEDAFGSPDGLWADPDGRLFIETDGSQPDGMNDQMLVADPNTGDLRRLLAGVTGAEVTGITVTPDRRTLFANLQHPGDGDPTLTNFPAPIDGVTIPRDATLVITRKDGGIVGS